MGGNDREQLREQLQTTMKMGREAGERLRSFTERITSQRDKHLTVLTELKTKMDSGQNDKSR